MTAAELRALKDAIEQRLGKSATIAVGKQRTAATRKAAAPMRWNPEPEDVQKSVAQLVLTIVEFLRRLMERQAIRRMEQKTLTKKEVEAVGAALMTLEQTVRDIGRQVRPHARGSQPRSRPARQVDVSRAELKPCATCVAEQGKPCATCVGQMLPRIRAAFERQLVQK